jgi:CDP-diacylglycerol--glycerol-3-phosphate 3-phosphatidyltransferase
MPWLNWPNRITIARIALVPFFVICLLNVNEPGDNWRYLAIALFAVMAFSDVLDGYLARKLDEATPLGRFLDPVGDKLLITCSMVLLALPDTAIAGFRLPAWVAVIAIGKDILTVIGFGLVYATTSRFFVEPRIWGKGCTLVQSVLVAFALVAPDLPAGAAKAWPLLWWVASALAIAAVADYLRIGNQFAARIHMEQKQKDNND